MINENKGTSWVERAVTEIVDAIFTDGFGRKAERLVMVLPNEKLGCGWWRGSVHSVIKSKIMEAIERKETDANNPD